MSHYSDNVGSVRVDFFKESGKWKYTEAIDMSDFYYDDLIHRAFRKALIKHFNGEVRFVGLRAICLEPHHKYSHPISLIVQDWTTDSD